MAADLGARGNSMPKERKPIVEQSGYNVRSDEIESALRTIAADIKPHIPHGFGFTLLFFSYGQTGLPGEGKEGSMFYISTGRREDMIRAMQEFIARHTQ
jgi:hypothetical protein